MSEIKTPFSDKRKPLHELLPLDQPLRVEIDPADVCNFKCSFCFHSKKDSDFYGKMMDRETFELIVSQLKEFKKPITKVYLYALGEPLINKDTPYFVSKLKEEGVAETVAITSNGSLLTHNLSDSLIGAGLDQLSISINGLCDEDYQRICNASIDFLRILDEIEYFYKNKNGCYLHVKLEGDYFSDEEKRKFFDIFHGKCDSMHIDNVSDIWPDMPIDSQENLYGLKHFDDMTVCPQPFYDMCIHTDGTVTPCDAIWNYKEYNFGNIKDRRLVEIWNTHQKSLCVEQLKNSRECSLAICNRCNFAKYGASVDITPYRERLLEEFSS